MQNYASQQSHFLHKMLLYLSLLLLSVFLYWKFVLVILIVLCCVFQTKHYSVTADLGLIIHWYQQRDLG